MGKWLALLGTLCLAVLITSLFTGWNIYSSEDQRFVSTQVPYRQTSVRPLEYTSTQSQMLKIFDFKAGVNELLIIGNTYDREGNHTASLWEVPYYFNHVCFEQAVQLITKTMTANPRTDLFWVELAEIGSRWVVTSIQPVGRGTLKPLSGRLICF